MAFWILKTEPGAYSWQDLKHDKRTNWDGVRNYQARNNLKQMKLGDLAMIYHSVGPREIVGTAVITKESFPDPTTDDDRWFAVEIKAQEDLKKPVSLELLKSDHRLSDLSLIKQSRLSVCPVKENEWLAIMELAMRSDL